MQEIVRDVSDLAPPEPMTVILTALATLANGHYLKVIHRREPFPLYEKLAANGWGYQCHQQDHQQSQTLFHLYIFREVDQHAFQQISAAFTETPTP